MTAAVIASMGGVDPFTSPGSYPYTVMALSPVGYWRLDEPSGTTATDSSGNGYDGTYLNTPTLGATGVLAEGNAAAEFIAGNEGMQVADGAEWNIFEGTTPWSIAMWVDMTAGDGTFRRLFAKDGAAGVSVNLQSHSSGLYAIRSNAGDDFALGSALSAGVHFVVMTFSGTVISLYIDAGTPATGASTRSVGALTSALTFGTDVGLSNSINGLMDEPAVFDFALSAGEVDDLYAALSWVSDAPTPAAKYLRIGGQDVIGSNTNYNVPLETIRLTEEGPGGVSSLSFSIWDPGVEVTFETSADVEFWDITNGRPLFRGFIASFAIRPTGPARWVDIDCIGIEVLLDWMLVPNYTVPAGTHFAAAIQSLVYNATGIGWPLRTNSHSEGHESPYSTQASPVAGYAFGYPTTQADVVIEGDTLRNAITTVVTACDTWVIGTGALATIDFYSGLRVLPTKFGIDDEHGIITTYTPGDYDEPTVDMNAGSSLAPSKFSFNVDSASVVRGVYVKGANANATGYVSDGSGIVGPVALISDDASVTVATRNAIAASYLAQFSQSIRGVIDFDSAPAGLISGNYRPGGTWFMSANLQVFDALIGLTVYSISKTFFVGGEKWSIAVGGFKGSAAKQLKRLTRSTRN